jgi:hypothetical protein
MTIGNFRLTYWQFDGRFMAKSTHNEERRNARRFQVAWQVAIKGADPLGRNFDEFGFLENLSSRGASFLMPRRVQPGAKIELQIRVPLKKENWMKYSAEVVRVKKKRGGFGVAVMFDTARPLFNEP